MVRAEGTRRIGPLRRPDDQEPRGRIVRRAARGLAVGVIGLLGAVSAPACTGTIDQAHSGLHGSNPNPGPVTGSGGTGATVATGQGGSSPITGAGGSGSTPDGTGSSTGTGGTELIACDSISPGRSPIRRLTTYEYNNTVRDLLGDTTSPGSALPAQVDSGQSLFGNDADDQSPSPLLVEKYQTVAESIAARATADSTALGKLNSCATNVTTANEESCARTIATSLVSRSYRRVASSTEVDELVTLYKTVRGLSTTFNFGSGVAAMIEALLQAPEFLYRVEMGTPVAANSAVKRVTGREMATRLSYLFWQTMPDAALFQVADSGMLDTNDGVAAQAKKMLDDQRSRQMVAFFFDNLLPIPDLAGLTRDTKNLFPTWSSSIGVAMRQEVQRVLQYEIFENTAQTSPPYMPGSWPAILTAPYTFVNKTLFTYYGASAFAPGTSVTGTDLTKVTLNPDQRVGLLTLGGMMAGLTTTDLTNPVLRGSFIINKLMCKNLSVPAGLNPVAPDPYSAKTARERYGMHSVKPECAVCHKMIDPLGLPFENFDAVGLYRKAEHWVDPASGTAYDTTIDSSGAVPGVTGTAANGLELVKLLASSPDIESCFASHWMRFAYGRSLQSGDACNQQSVNVGFSGGNFNVKQLLLAVTQSDGFLYRPAQ